MEKEMIGVLESLLGIHRTVKRRILMATDLMMVAASIQLAAIFRQGSVQPFFDSQIWLLITVVVPVSGLVFWRLGFYRLVIRYMNHRTVLMIFTGVMASALTVFLTNVVMGRPLPRSVAIIHTLLVLVSVGGIRFLLREFYLYSRRRQRKPVVIYGAGAAGCELVNALRHGGEYEPVAFVDDWRGLEGTLVEGLKVHRPKALPQLVAKHKAAMVLLAIPSAPRSRRREIINALAEASISVQTIPGSADVIAGRARISELRHVSVEDLLGRDPVPPNPELLGANIRHKVVMVTGAGGSIGSELCRQILAHEPARLLLLDNCEFALYAIEQELQRANEAAGQACEIKAFLASVQQRDCLDTIFETFPVHTVYHAAAYKHVPIVENNFIEGIRNNVFGTLSMARAAIAGGVETFVLVSTDKAVRPTNIMGASKRLTELICQAFAHEQGKTRFCMVRFGNVLGSSGSVVPLFRRQIERGGPVQVTHPEITRYFMTIPEAAQLVIQAGALGRSGDVFVLDMGEPVRIHDLAVNMIHLSGLEVKDDENLNGDIEIIYTGLRPGEKLYEELLIGDDVSKTCHPRIMRSREVFWPWARLEALLGELKEAGARADHRRLRQLMLEAPLDYRPQGELVDLVWEERKLRLHAKQKKSIGKVSPAAFGAMSPLLEPLTKDG